MAGLFDHKYPITNLHELDLSWVIMEVQSFRNTLDSWKDLIDELKAGLEQLNKLDERLTYIEELTSGLNAAYAAIDALSIDNVHIHEDLKALRVRIINLENLLYAEVDNLRTYIDNKVTTERTARINADFELDVMIRSVMHTLSDQIDYINYRLDQIIPEKVFNRVAGVKLLLNDNNFNIYEDLRDLGISNATLSEYGIDNDHVAALHLNNRDYAINAFKRFKLQYVFSPVTGVRVSHANALSQIVALFAAGADNDTLFTQMATDSATNEDLGNYYDSNLERYAVTV
jgi:hypothetical protein